MGTISDILTNLKKRKGKNPFEELRCHTCHLPSEGPAALSDLTQRWKAARRWQGSSLCLAIAGRGHSEVSKH